MKYVALGATDVIGASSHYLKIGETGIVLDAGADPEQEGMDSVPRYDLVKSAPDSPVDHAVITHAHHDHLGSLPVLIRTFPHVHVHMTQPTLKLADMLLPASARLQQRKLREGSSTAPPIFDEEELKNHGYLYHAHALEDEFDLTGLRGGTPITGRLYDAGHVLGSAGVYIEFEEDGEQRTLFYTSDTNLRPQTIIPGGSYPEGPIDILLLESTLGADPEAEHTTRRSEEKRFGESLARVLDRGGTVLIPVFVLGRAQEIIALIDRYKERRIIPEDIPVYTAGSMRAIADIYDKTRYLSPRLDEEFQVFGVPQKRLPRSESRIAGKLNEPSIHIVGSGMMFERTLSNRLGRQLIEHERNAVFFVGYARPDSPARRLTEAREQGQGTEVVLSDSRGSQKVMCDVERFRFSGHSHRRDLIELVEKLQPKKVVLVHGETSARQWMTDNINYFYPEIPVIAPALGETLEL